MQARTSQGRCTLEWIADDWMDPRSIAHQTTTPHNPTTLSITTANAATYVLRWCGPALIMTRYIEPGALAGQPHRAGMVPVHARAVPSSSKSGVFGNPIPSYPPHRGHGQRQAVFFPKPYNIQEHASREPRVEFSGNGRRHGPIATKLCYAPIRSDSRGS
jgi:hypothetical protein